MSAINTGGPAFPVTFKYCIGHDANGLPAYSEDTLSGMTLRDYFAAKAMPCFCNPQTARFLFGKDAADPDSEFLSFVAKRAYEMADAMLAAREKCGA